MSRESASEERAEAEIECQHLDMHTTHIWMEGSSLGAAALVENMLTSQARARAREVFWGLGGQRCSLQIFGRCK